MPGVGQTDRHPEAYGTLRAGAIRVSCGAAVSSNEQWCKAKTRSDSPENEAGKGGQSGYNGTQGRRQVSSVTVRRGPGGGTGRCLQRDRRFTGTAQM